MIKFVLCIRRLPHLSREEFQDYWLNHHGPLVASFQDKMGMIRYVQLHTLSTPMDSTFLDSGSGEEPFDGIAESWWDSWEAFQSALMDSESESIFSILREDEKKFIDQPRSIMWFGKEHTIIER